MGSFHDSKTQIGTESTKGTGVAATTVWRGPAAHIRDTSRIHFPKENVGSLPGKDRAVMTQQSAVIPFPETEATFEQLGYVLGSAVEAESGVQDGTGSDYIYTFDPPVASSPALSYIKSRTIETGDGTQAEESEYCLVTDFRLRGVIGEPVMLTANWFGRKAQQSTFTGAVSVPTVEEILASKTKLYIDNAAGTIGSTQVTGELLEWEVNYISGWGPQYAADGNLYFSKAFFGMPEMTVSLLFEHETNAIAEKELFRSTTARLIRLLAEGSAVATPGTTYSYKTLIIDSAGKWESFEEVAEKEGLSTIRAAFKVRENDTAALYAQFVLVNELSALP